MFATLKISSLSSHWVQSWFSRCVWQQVYGFCAKIFVSFESIKTSGRLETVIEHFLSNKPDKEKKKKNTSSRSICPCHMQIFMRIRIPSSNCYKMYTIDQILQLLLCIRNRYAYQIRSGLLLTNTRNWLKVRLEF